jgi:hypothetical protein
MKSTQGGIGVENLQGSGLIAGETSRAYQVPVVPGGPLVQFIPLSNLEKNHENVDI